MTIAAGFVCTDGIVLCADTEVTGETRQQGRKLWVSATKSRNSCLAVAGAGSMVQITSIAERIGDVVKAQMSIGDFKTNVEGVLAEFYRQHIYPIPQWQDHCDLQFLIAFRTPGWLRLFEVNHTALARVRTFACIGSGTPVAEYISTTLFRSGAVIRECQALAAYVLQQTKRYGRFCGGDSHILTIPAEGPPGFQSPADVTFDELCFGGVLSSIGPLAFAARDAQDFDAKVETFKERIGSRRLRAFNLFEPDPDEDPWKDRPPDAEPPDEPDPTEADE